MYPWMVPMCESIHGYMGTGMLWVWVWVSPQVPAGLPMQNPRHSAPGKDVSTIKNASQDGISLGYLG